MENRQIQVRAHILEDFLALEGIKTLRSNLMFSGIEKRVFGITSCNPSEGKSTTTFQLAASFAQLNKRVLLLDVDLRKSAAAQKFGFSETEKGVSHFLSGMASLEEIIYQTDIPGMDIIYAGRLVPNASELLAGQAFRDMLDVLRKTYDYVIVDTPPLGQVIDCAVIAADLDGIIILIDTTNNSYRAEKRIQEQIEKAGGKVLGVVLNKVDFSGRFGYYGKSYGRKYAYE
jgi:capsular exopolysaccharide synthesis family protein